MIMILDYVGLHLTIFHYISLYLIILDGLGLSWSWILLDYIIKLDYMEFCWIMLDYIGLHWSLLDYIGL